MRTACLLLVVVLLESACASAPKTGADLGSCQFQPSITFRSDEKRMGVCTPGETETWRKFFVHVSKHNDYSYGGTADASVGYFFARLGEPCADMRPGLIPSSIDSGERYAFAAQP